MKQEAELQSEFVWGAEAIGLIVGLNKRETNYALVKGRLPARKEGRLWVASREALRRHLRTPSNGYQSEQPMAA